MSVIVGAVITGAVLIGIIKIARRATQSAPATKASLRSESSAGSVVTSNDHGAAISRDGPETSKAAVKKFWVPLGHAVDIAGRHMEGGLLYVGSGLTSALSTYEPEAALIDPRLKVTDPQACSSGTLEYWPTYKGITPACRAVYLDWLANGRRDPGIDIGFVFLYFYGLERRVVFDARTTALPDLERQAIGAEIERLLAVYGENQSFNSYATSLLELMLVASGREPVYKSPPPLGRRSWDVPVLVRVALGEMSRDGVPLSAEWAYAWARRDPRIGIRTPAERCQNEMQRLFTLRYQRRFGDGMVLKPCKRTVAFDYRPASRSLAGVAASVEINVPDIANLSGPIGKLRELFDDCCNDLDAYSRWLGRHPESAGTLQAVALLPPDLATIEDMGEEAKQLQAMLAAALAGKQAAAIESESILRFWPPARNDKYAKSDSLALAQFLEKIGYGLEPDVRFGGPRLDGSRRAVVFTVGRDAQAAPTNEYWSVTLSLLLASTVAVADDVVTDEELASLRQHIDGARTLAQAERARLHAHLEWLLAERPGLGGVKRRLEGIDTATRHLLGQFLLTMAAADGSVAPVELKAIGKLYAQLGLDPDTVYSDLHKLAFATEGPASEPITVRGQDLPKGYAIPAPAAPGTRSSPAARVVLDPRLVEAKRREAERATLLLSSIFTEDEPDSRRTQPATPASGTIAGLDSAHGALLERLAGQEAWTMNEIAPIAAKLGLMADGALETINEAAWDRAGEAVLDIGETVTINRTVWEAMRS